MDTLTKSRCFFGRLGNIFFRLSIFSLVVTILCVCGSVITALLTFLYMIFALAITVLTLFTVLLIGNPFSLLGSGLTDTLVRAMMVGGAVMGICCVVFSVLSAIMMLLDVPVNRARDKGKSIAMVVIAILGLIATIVAFVMMAR